MNKIVLAAALTAGLALANCSSGTADKVVATANDWAAKVDNFNRAAAAVNVDIVAKTSTTAAGYCTQAKSIGQNMTRIVSPSTGALNALGEITAALNDFCAAPPQDVASAVNVLTQAIADAKAHGG